VGCHCSRDFSGKDVREHTEEERTMDMMPFVYLMAAITFVLVVALLVSFTFSSRSLEPVVFQDEQEERQAEEP
jgi:hypothetical protein